jgi:hypothetical protein
MRAPCPRGHLADVERTCGTCGSPKTHRRHRSRGVNSTPILAGVLARRWRFAQRYAARGTSGYMACQHSRRGETHRETPGSGTNSGVVGPRCAQQMREGSCGPWTRKATCAPEVGWGSQSRGRAPCSPWLCRRLTKRGNYAFHRSRGPGSTATKIHWL